VGVQREPQRIEGKILHCRIRSKALKAYGYFNMYIPPGYVGSRERYPVVYLFRGHEREWFNPTEDSTRSGSTAAHVLESLVRRGKMAPVLLVAPGLVSRDERFHALGVNMSHPQTAAKHTGIGMGAFEDYFIHELMPHIDSHFRTKPERRYRAADGFSLGGYSATMLVCRHPELFAGAGCYDATHMWLDFVDRRKDGNQPNDETWLTNPLFDAAFGVPRNMDRMLEYNPSNIIASAEGERRRWLERTVFTVHSANFDGNKGNKHRAQHFEGILKAAGLSNSVPRVALHSEAAHTWKDADRHLEASLLLHQQTFESGF